MRLIGRFVNEILVIDWTIMGLLTRRWDKHRNVTVSASAKYGTLMISARMIAWVRSFDPSSTRGTNDLTGHRKAELRRSARDNPD